MGEIRRLSERDRQLLIEFAKYAKKYDGITKFATAEHLVDGFIERNPHLFSQRESREEKEHISAIVHCPNCNLERDFVKQPVCKCGTVSIFQRR